MSYSLLYCKERLKNTNLDFSAAEEKASEQYFDRFMKGDRARLVDTPYGKIKVVIDFKEDADFNHIDCFGGVRFGFEDDLETQILHSVYEILCGNVHIPLEDGNPVGGYPEAGDAIHVTFGNIVVINTFEVNNGSMKQDLEVLVPKKYVRVVGGMND